MIVRNDVQLFIKSMRLWSATNNREYCYRWHLACLSFLQYISILLFRKYVKMLSLRPAALNQIQRLLLNVSLKLYASWSKLIWLFRGKVRELSAISRRLSAWKGNSRFYLKQVAFEKLINLRYCTRLRKKCIKQNETERYSGSSHLLTRCSKCAVSGPTIWRTIHNVARYVRSWIPRTLKLRVLF